MRCHSGTSGNDWLVVLLYVPNPTILKFTEISRSMPSRFILQLTSYSFWRIVRKLNAGVATPELPPDIVYEVTADKLRGSDSRPTACDTRTARSTS